MNREELLMRAGFYAGLAARELSDDSYMRRFLGHAEDITEAEFLEMVADVSWRLIAAGKLRADEDAFETFLKQATT